MVEHVNTLTLLGPLLIISGAMLLIASFTVTETRPKHKRRIHIAGLVVLVIGLGLQMVLQPSVLSIASLVLMLIALVMTLIAYRRKKAVPKE